MVRKGMSRIRYGIIGFGGIAENRIAKEGFHRDTTRFGPHPHAELAAATDLDPRRRAAVESLGLKWYDSPEAMLSREHLEAVFVATNNSSHAAAAEISLRAGKHCLVEKPIATSLQDLRRLQRIASEAGLNLAVDHMMEHNSYNRHARALVRDGAIGPVNDICLHMEFLYGATRQEAATWRCAKPEELGGPIGDVGSHCLYMAEFLLDSRIRRLSCVYLPRTLDIEVENGAFVQFVTQSGVEGSARVAFNHPRGGATGTLLNLGYELYGDGGILRGLGTMFQLSGHPDEPVQIRLAIDKDGGSETVRLDDNENIYSATISAHALSIREGRFVESTEALHNLSMILACHQSAQEGGKMVEIAG
jgi:1,5-anhydro-D-fructose reductase (1,5-anhydro-D-mannitol-forming)